MITLCLAHHAMVTRTLVLLEDWPELLRVLWREQHPEAHEQTALDFMFLVLPPNKPNFWSPVVHSFWNDRRRDWRLAVPTRSGGPIKDFKGY